MAQFMVSTGKLRAQVEATEPEQAIVKALKAWWQEAERVAIQNGSDSLTLVTSPLMLIESGGQEWYARVDGMMKKAGYPKEFVEQVARSHGYRS